MTETLPEDLVSARRAAGILGCTPSTVGRYRDRGLLCAWRRAGSYWMYSEAEVRSLLEPARTDQRLLPPSRAEIDRRVGQAMAELREMGLDV
jgi:hypothetical protein